MYTCPMHLEIVSKDPGKCPKCGMNLVKEGEKVEHNHHHGIESSYTPLVVIIGLIITVASVVSFKTGFTPLNFITSFMIGFFITFAGFKLIDLKGFAEGYSTYDLLAQKWFGYGYIYPFIELLFGLGMILIPQSKGLLWTEFIIMTFSGLGVAIKLAKREEFQCACLGTFLKVPLTKVTLVEDFGMAALALILLLNY